MNITYKATDYSITPDIEERVDAKVRHAGKLLGYDADTALVEVELSRTEHGRTGDIYRAEVNADAGGRLYRATADAETMEAAIDKVQDELMRELRRAKRKNRGVMRRTGAAMKDWMRGWSS
jgi:ribosomal subunit interface protein